MRMIDIDKNIIVKLFLSLIFVMVATFLSMLVFETVKQTLYPDITIWESHIVTIIFVTTIATIMSFFVIHKIVSDTQRLTSERRARELTDAALAEARIRAEIYLDLMCHDIRNLDQIAMGYLEIALDSLELDDEKRMLLSRPLEALQSSTKLINNIKKLQSIRGGEPINHVIDVGQVLREVISRYSSIVGRDITINLTVEDDSKVFANNLLTDVFSNIIENSIKHSQNKLVIDVVEKDTTYDERKFIMVTISDNGPGIPDILKKKLFARFEKDRLDRSARGLGLYLVKTLVDDFHGRVWAENVVPDNYARGVKIVVLLPAADRQ